MKPSQKYLNSFFCVFSFHPFVAFFAHTFRYALQKASWLKAKSLKNQGKPIFEMAS
jgi:hypothetical protein